MALPLPLRDNLFAPRFSVRVEGTTLSEDTTQFIQGVTFSEAENSASKIGISLKNPGFRFTDSRIFAEGNVVDLWLGYEGAALHHMNQGLVTRYNPGFPREGMPMIEIEAYDASQKLMDVGPGDRGRAYRKMRDSDMAADVFGTIGALTFGAITKRVTTRFRKKGTSKWEFLQRLAKLHGYVVAMRHSVVNNVPYGYFGPPQEEDQGTSYNFVYGTGEPDATLLEFTPDIQTAGQRTSVEVTYRNPKSKKTHRLTVEVTRSEAEQTKFTAAQGTKKMKRPLLNGPKVTFTVHGQREEVVAGRPFQNAKDARRFAAAWWADRERDFAFGRGVVVGTPNLRRGHVHQLTGLGNRLSGKWLITSTTHRMAAGALYETEFTATKVALSSVIGVVGNFSNVKHSEAAP